MSEGRKSGILIYAAYACILISCLLIIFLPGTGWFFAAPLFFAVLVLCIVAMTRGIVSMSIFTLIVSMILPAGVQFVFVGLVAKCGMNSIEKETEYLHTEEAAMILITHSEVGEVLVDAEGVETDVEVRARPEVVEANIQIEVPQIELNVIREQLAFRGNEGFIEDGKRVATTQLYNGSEYWIKDAQIILRWVNIEGEIFREQLQSSGVLQVGESRQYRFELQDDPEIEKFEFTIGDFELEL